jgi:hypothetical protein
MFLLAGFNPRGRRVLWGHVRCGDGPARWTRLYRFECGDFAWIGRRLGWARFVPTWISNVDGMQRWEIPGLTVATRNVTASSISSRQLVRIL